MRTLTPKFELALGQIPSLRSMTQCLPRLNPRGVARLGPRACSSCPRIVRLSPDFCFLPVSQM